MSADVLNKLLSYCALGTGHGAKRDKVGLSRLPGADQGASGQSDRTDCRSEERYAFQGLCHYEMIEGVTQSQVLLQRGEAITVNVSSQGVMLLMDQPPQVHQLIEIRPALEAGRREFSLFEVRWSRPVPEAMPRTMHLVGCRLKFGVCPYFLLRRAAAVTATAHR